MSARESPELLLTVVPREEVMSQERMAKAGFGLALVSAATFSTSGTFARSLTDAGWSTGAAVATRVTVAALVLALPTVLALRGRWHVLRRNAALVVAYGLIAVAGCQVFFFNAVQHLSVGVALLLEYMGTVLVVAWMWMRHGHRPRRLTVAGSVVALTGLVLVLDLTGDRHLDAVGVLWALGAAVGLAVFFVLSSEGGEDLPPVAVASTGMAIGAVTLLALGAIGALPMHAQLGDVAFAGRHTSWLVPVVGLSLVAAAIAYVAGIGAARQLGPKLASFVGLTEVVFAVLFAWLLLGELPTGIQLGGGLLIVAGIALVRIDELRPAQAPVTAPHAALALEIAVRPDPVP
jgi:drug/metabolite transporter (DMT)-like permease